MFQKSNSIAKLYINVIIDKKLIYKELKNQSGIYLKNITGDQYIGSGINLQKRIAAYFEPPGAPALTRGRRSKKV